MRSAKYLSLSASLAPSWSPRVFRSSCNLFRGPITTSYLWISFKSSSVIILSPRLLSSFPNCTNLSLFWLISSYRLSLFFLRPAMSSKSFLSLSFYSGFKDSSLMRSLRSDSSLSNLATNFWFIASHLSISSCLSFSTYLQSWRTWRFSANLFCLSATSFYNGNNSFEC